MFNTIHIFEHGETQIIAEEINFKVNSSELTSLGAFINHLNQLRPSDVLESNYRVIHVFNGDKAMYLAHSEDNSQRRTFFLKFDQIDQAILSSLVQELLTKAQA